MKWKTCIIVLVNLCFRIGVVTNQVSTKESSLSDALMGALNLAIIASGGAGRRFEMIDVANQVCKSGTLLFLLSEIPLALLK